jgi:hypothetical protein
MITPTDQPIGHLPSLNAYRVLNKVGCADFPHENFVSASTCEAVAENNTRLRPRSELIGSLVDPNAASHKPPEVHRTVQQPSKCGVFCCIVGYSEVQDLDGWIWMPVRSRHQIRV